MNRFFLFLEILTLVLGTGLKIVPVILAQSLPELQAETVSFPQRETFPDFAKIFDSQTKVTLPPNVTADQLVASFCTACKSIDACLTEIDSLQRQIQELESTVKSEAPSVSEVSQMEHPQKPMFPEQQSSSPEQQPTSPATGQNPFVGTDAPSFLPESEVVVSTPDLKIKELRSRIELLEHQTYFLYHQTLEWIGPVWKLAPHNPEVTRYVFFLLVSAIEQDQYESAYVLSRELMRQNIYEKEPVLYEMAGISAFMVSKFDVARLCFSEAEKSGVLTGTGSVYQELIPYCSQAWKTEQAVRGQEARKAELPRVLLQTTRGDIEIELFEDSAPETVSAFLRLVNDGFYDENAFSSVISGLFAQTDRTRSDLAIPDEFSRPDARKHFRGSLVLSHDGRAGSANGRFFIMLAPAPQLDGKFTVFGRVTKGMEVVASLTRVDERNDENPQTPQKSDRILAAKILNRQTPEAEVHP